MKDIKKTTLEGATVLSAAEMNDICFETGMHSEARPAETGTGTTTMKTEVATGSADNRHTSLR